MYVHYFIFSFHTISTFSMSMLHWITIDTFKPSVWCLKVFMGKKFFPLATDPKNLRILHETTMLFCPAKIASWLCLTLWYSLMNLDLFKACICLKLLCSNVSFDFFLFISINNIKRGDLVVNQSVWLRLLSIVSGGKKNFPILAFVLRMMC